MGADPLINLHNHTIYSDGWHTPEQVVLRAWQGGLKAVAITDHLATTKVPHPLEKDDLPRYLRNLLALKEMYRGRMEVLAGVEIDCNPERCDLDRLPFELINQLDLVLFEYAGDRLNGGASFAELRPIFQQVTVPKGLCHWDIDRIFPQTDPDDVVSGLSDMDLFVEVSTSDYYRREGKPYYVLGERFFQRFNGRVKVSIGTDMHRRIDEVVNISSGVSFVRRLGLEGQI